MTAPVLTRLLIFGLAASSPSVIRTSECGAVNSYVGIKPVDQAR